MSELNKDEKVSVTKSSFDMANVIIAVAILIAVIGVLKYLDMLPF